MTLTSKILYRAFIGAKKLFIYIKKFFNHISLLYTQLVIFQLFVYNIYLDFVINTHKYLDTWSKRCKFLHFSDTNSTLIVVLLRKLTAIPTTTAIPYLYVIGSRHSGLLAELHARAHGRSEKCLIGRRATT